MGMVRDRILAALNKRLPESPDDISLERFDPWSDVVSGVAGSYAEEMDEIFIEALEAARDLRMMQFIKERGLAAEIVAYVLSANHLTDYGTSPRGGFPDHELKDLWQPLIDKWKAYREIVWRD